MARLISTLSIDRAGSAIPDPLTNQEAAAPTGQTPVQTLTQREETDDLHAIFDQCIIGHLHKPEVQSRLKAFPPTSLWRKFGMSYGRNNLNTVLTSAESIVLLTLSGTV